MVQDAGHAGVGRVPPGVVGHGDLVWPVTDHFAFCMEKFPAGVSSLQMSCQLLTLCYLVQHCFILAIVSKTLETILNSQLLGMAIASVELKHTHSNPSDHVARVVRHPPLRHLFLEVELLLQVDVQNGGDVFSTVSSHKRTAEGGPPGKSN